MFEQLIPLHPKLVHFPIALFISALGFELLAYILRKDPFHKTAVYLFTAAALMSFVVVQTGLWEQARLHLNHPVLTEHRLYGLWTMWLSLLSLPVLWVLRTFLPKYFRPVFLVVLIAVSVLVFLTAHEGGEMVYEYGVGVEK